MGIAVSRWYCATVLKKWVRGTESTFFATLVFEKHAKSTVLGRVLKKNKLKKSFHCLPPDFSDFLPVPTPDELVETRRSTD